MKRKIFFVTVLIIGVMLLGLNAMAGKQKTDKHPEADFTMSCVECHTDVTPQAVKEWEQSAHGVMNFGCYMCHGDGEIEFYAQPGTERCVSCHGDVDIDWNKALVKNCFGCHKGHSLKFHE